MHTLDPHPKVADMLARAFGSPKLDVHSQQELIDLVEKSGDTME